MINVGISIYDLKKTAEKKESEIDPILIHKIDRLIDLTIFRTKRDGVLKASAELSSDFLDFRFELTKNKAVIQEFLEEADNAISETIVTQFESTPNHVELESSYVRTLDVYKSIFQKLTAKTDLSLFTGMPEVGSEKDLIALFSLIPNGQHIFVHLKQLIDLSTKLDYLLLCAALIFHDELDLEKEQVQRLTEMLTQTVEDYAVSMAVFGLWSPSDDDERQIIRNAKIKLSYLNSMRIKDSAKRYSLDDLQQLLAA